MEGEGVTAASAEAATVDTVLTLFGFGANLAAIVTAIVAVWLWFSILGQRKMRRIALEDYLKSVKTAGDGYERRTVLHLMANLRMTEAQIFEAAFESKHVRTSPGQDHTGIANRIYFEYTTGNEEEDLKLARNNSSSWPRPHAR